MTDRHAGYIVTLDADIGLLMVENRAVHKLRSKLRDVLWKKS